MVTVVPSWTSYWEIIERNVWRQGCKFTVSATIFTRLEFLWVLSSQNEADYEVQRALVTVIHRSGYNWRIEQHYSCTVSNLFPSLWMCLIALTLSARISASLFHKLKKIPFCWMWNWVPKKDINENLKLFLRGFERSRNSLAGSKAYPETTMIWRLPYLEI